MKAVNAAVFFTGLASAHSGVWKINIDGTEYVDSHFFTVVILIIPTDTQVVTQGSMTA
jgi:hypothetical protein